MGQKSLAFFGFNSTKKPATPKAAVPESKVEKTSESKKEESKETTSKDECSESPIKVAPSKRRARIVESDSEEEEVNKSNSSSPTKSEEEKENKSEKSVEASSTASASKSEESSSKSHIGFSPDTVPPLRITARKQMKRKSDCLEDKQKEMVKKMKMTEEEEEESMEVDEVVKSSKKRSSPKKKKTPPTKMKETMKNFFTKFQAPKKDEDSDEESIDGEVKIEMTSADEDTSAKTEETEKETPVKSSPSEETEKKTPKSSVKKAVKDSTTEESTPKRQSRKGTPKSSAKKNGKEATPKSVKDSNKKSKSSTKKNSKSDECNKSVEKESSPIKCELDSPVKSDASPVKSDASPVKSESNPVKSESSPVKSDSSPIKSESSPVKSESGSPTKSKESVDSPNPADRPVKKMINPFAPKAKSDACDGKGYDPTKKNYHPIDDAIWKQGQRVPYLALAKTFQYIEDTSGRLRTIEILSNLLRSIIVLTPEDLLYTVYLCLNKVAPAFAGLELNVGDQILLKAVAQTTGRSMERLKADARELGDIGKVAERSKSTQRTMFQPAPLTMRGVFDKLKEIALMTGNSVQSKKVDKIKGMFVACRESEARYLIRSLGGKLRIGLAEQSVLQAIGQACYLTPPGQSYPPEILNSGKGMSAENVKSKVEEFALVVKTTYCECPSYDEIMPVILSTGVMSLPDHCKLTPGVPLKPMLAHPTKGVSEVFKRFEDNKFTCEYKYDGERAQIHLSEDGTVNVYSRNQENNTTKYPDIISRLKGSLGENVKSCILDSEAVAWDREKKQILPFQVLSTRKRKDVDEKDIKVQVCVFPFDLLYLNGESLVRKPFEMRRRLLMENFNEVEGEFTFAKSMDSTNTEDIQDFLEESIKGNCEGLMVKTLDVDATYEIAKRSHNWLKLKKDYLDGVGDSIDVVVLGGFMGKGKRAGSYGGFLLGCYDPTNEEFQSICKIGTGFSDESLQKHTEFLKQHVIERPKSYYRFDSSVEPDEWFDAVQVWEIKCADLSISPVHKAAAGIVDPEKGISLRFPRFLRIREDKTPETATSAQQIADMYNDQDQIKNKVNDQKENEDFY